MITLEQARANITKVGASYVFVRYDGNQYPKATAPEQLDWMSGGAA